MTSMTVNIPPIIATGTSTEGTSPFAGIKRWIGTSSSNLLDSIPNAFDENTICTKVDNLYEVFSVGLYSCKGFNDRYSYTSLRNLVTTYSTNNQTTDPNTLELSDITLIARAKVLTKIFKDIIIVIYQFQDDECINIHLYNSETNAENRNKSWLYLRQKTGEEFPRLNPVFALVTPSLEAAYLTPLVRSIDDSYAQTYQKLNDALAIAKSTRNNTTQTTLLQETLQGYFAEHEAAILERMRYVTTKNELIRKRTEGAMARFHHDETKQDLEKADKSVENLLELHNKQQVERTREEATLRWKIGWFLGLNKEHTPVDAKQYDIR